MLSTRIFCADGMFHLGLDSAGRGGINKYMGATELWEHVGLGTDQWWLGGSFLHPLDLEG